MQWGGRKRGSRVLAGRGFSRITGGHGTRILKIASDSDPRSLNDGGTLARMLIVLGGLPGVGKTTIARALARAIGAMHIRIDSIELAIRESGLFEGPMNDAGYRVGYAVAEDNLRLGRMVIADSVNPLPITREAWRAVATRAQVKLVEVEVVCSDEQEHRRRVEGRLDRRPAESGPTWAEVVARDYRAWDRDHVVIETAGRTAEQLVATLRTCWAAGTANPIGVRRHVLRDRRRSASRFEKRDPRRSAFPFDKEIRVNPRSP